jgi:hypothetical protein
MLRFPLDKLAAALNAFNGLQYMMKIADESGRTPFLAENDRQYYLGHARALCQLLDEIALSTSKRGCERIVGALAHLQANPANPAVFQVDKGVFNLLNHFITCIQDELPSIMVWQVPRERTAFFERTLFGGKVAQQYPSAATDIEEAGKCLAMGRSTACVFHLMRVMEAGLRSLGASLKDENLDPNLNPNWETILRRCDRELQKPLSERTPEWRTDGAFLSTATANLRAVKEAWRNPTLHVERSYDDEEAFDVWNAARAFMRHLAGRLSEKSS